VTGERRRDLRRLRARLAHELAELDADIDRIRDLPPSQRVSETTQLRERLADLSRRMDADRAARPRDYELWSRWRIVRWFQQWRAFGSERRDPP
jgi:hypothetical protein